MERPLALPEFKGKPCCVVFGGGKKNSVLSSQVKIGP